ncbi:MAG TPA: SDR family NAD(P)-dependent oxidoreductase [Methylobacter sp.]|jgi:NAD(P)-dependent dehydrogenase (short-subunit alcohol dehydrogenase family)
MSRKLENKTAVITGAAKGIGFETARLFGKEGAKVTIMDIDEQSAIEAAKKLGDEGIEAYAFQLDVTDAESVEKTFQKAIANYSGVLNILVNNAGIADFGTVENTSLDVWNRIMAVNLNGTFFCSKAAIPSMKAHGGSIVNFGSVAGVVGIPGMAAYCAAKAAVVGLTKQMAADYSGQGIRTNCVCPGTIASTALGQQLLGSDTSEETQKKRLAKYPLGRFGEPVEIAQAVLFLASDQASFVSGAAFNVDGGMTAI